MLFSITFLVEIKLNRKVLGIDPGFQNLGWAIKDEQSWITGVLTLSGRTSTRVKLLYDWLHLHARDVKVIGVEGLVVGGNVTLASNLKSIIAVVALFSADMTIPLFEIRPATHRFSICGVGKRCAEFDSVVAEILGYSPDTTHEFDAVSVGETAHRVVLRRVSSKVLRGIRRL